MFHPHASLKLVKLSKLGIILEVLKNLILNEALI